MKKLFKILVTLLIINLFTFYYPKKTFGDVGIPIPSCSDYGGTCVDVSLCGSDRGEMIYGTDCNESIGEICCKPFSPLPSDPISETSTPNIQNTSLVIENPLSPVSDIWQLIMRLIQIAQNIGFFVCVILIVWAGYLYVTSVGNEQKIKQAQKTLIWALVGFGILIIAGAIPPLIYEFITGKSWENLYNEGSSESGGDRGKYDTMELSNGGVYPASQPLGGMVYNSSSGECYWNEYANGDDSECTSDLLI